MVTGEHLERSKAIQRRTGRTFHIATRFLPERVRHPTYVLYAFFRTADDVVDDTDPPPASEQRAALEQLRAAALGERAAEDPVVAAFAAVRERHGIPAREVEIFLDAMRADVDASSYETYADLESYLRGSAVAVAYMMLEVMGTDDVEAARPHARALGEAFQLTNFLRDVREDVVDYDRVYLPEATLADAGIGPADVAELRSSDAVADAVARELPRTEERYREGVAGIELLPGDCQFPVLLAAVLYAEHHRGIRERDCDVLSEPPSLGPSEYLRATARTLWHWRRTRDPETAFYRASAIDQHEPTPTPVGDRASAVRAAETVDGGDGEAHGSARALWTAGTRYAGALRSKLPGWRPE